MTIHLLDDATIGKIAAGEVVERPASAVKELVENALDAGARSIRIEVCGGGKERITVIDDGVGMTPDELALSITRHATSKIQTFQDLHHLTSYGFRGEALASIAAVTDIEIVSRARGTEHAARLTARFGSTPTIRTVAAAPGTAITVRDLFANVPARRAFLRQDTTETGYIHRAVTACALARPDVRFDLAVDGKAAFVTDGSGSLGNTVAGVLGPQIAAQMVPIRPEEPSSDGDEHATSVSGYIGLPTVTRGNRQQLILLVNGRWIESRNLGFAVEQAYHTLIMVGRYPVAVINIAVDPSRLDVNVHPTKREVRFSDERAVFSAVQRAVRETLVGYTPAQSVPRITGSPLTPDTVQRRLTLADPERATAQPQESAEERGTAHDPLPADRPANRLPVMRVLGQIASTYIIAEAPDGMYLIDQHAAHERVLLERLLEAANGSAPDVQLLLEPLVMEMTPEQLATVDQVAGELRTIGYEVEAFGGSSVAVRAVPAVASGRDPAAVLRGVLDDMAAGGSGDSPFESLAMLTACHSAIRAGQALSLAEMRELIVELERCAAPRACAHGRPTMLHLSQEELERQFARR